MNGGWLDPETHTLIISAAVEDVVMCDEEPGRVMIEIENLIEGIEVAHGNNRLWRPA